MDPVTREELFLAAAAGENVTLPEPVTRTEMFLKKIAENAGNGSGGSGSSVLTNNAAALLVSILRNGVYSTDQSTYITALETALASGGDSGGGDNGNTPDTATYLVVNSLTNATNSNAATSISENASYSATLTASDGYELETVTVTVGGVDVTSEVYAEGQINIAAVTGDVVIIAIASVPRVLLNNWDLTNSLTDTVGGVTASLTDSGATQDASGVTLDHSTEPGGYIYMADVVALNTTIEVDVACLTAGVGTHSRLLMLTNRTHSQLNGSTVSTAVANGLIFKSNAEWEVYSMDSAWTAVDGYTDVGLFDGKTAKLKLYEKDGLYYMDAYCNSELVVSVSTAASPATMPHLIISANKNGISGVITAVRIYEGV